MKLNRDDLLEKTIKYATENGWHKTSVREISKEIGYSTIKIYSEFGGKEGLLNEIQKKGFKLLREEYIKASSLKETPEEQLVEICLAHFRFAMNHSSYYDLMFTNNDSLCQSISPEILTYSAAPVKSVIEKIDSANVKIHFLHWFSLVHGFYEVAYKNMAKRGIEAELLLEKISRDFIKGIK